MQTVTQYTLFNDIRLDSSAKARHTITEMGNSCIHTHSHTHTDTDRVESRDKQTGRVEGLQLKGKSKATLFLELCPRLT